MSLTVRDLEKLQSDYPDYRMELVHGEIIVMSPSGYESDEVAVSLSALLWNWVHPRRLGRVTGSSAGFKLPNSDTRAADVSFVMAERLRRSPRFFAELAPDLMVEVKSPTDSLTKLREKIAQFLDLGTKVGILINPDKHIVELYRLGQAVEVLQDDNVLTVSDLLPGWEVEVSQLWPLVFE